MDTHLPLALWIQDELVWVQSPADTYMVSSRSSVGERRSGDGEASDDSEWSDRDVSGVRADSDASSLPGGVRHVRQNSSSPYTKW